MSKTKESFDIEATIKKTKENLRSNDIGKVLKQFSDLAELYLSKNAGATTDLQKLFESLHELYECIEPKIKWQKDVKKNQGKLAFYRNMAKIYQDQEKTSEAFQCYKKLVTNFINTLTKKNFKEYSNALFDDFDEGRKESLIANKAYEYIPVMELALKRIDSENIQKVNNLFYILLMRDKAYLRKPDVTVEEDLKLQKERLQVLLASAQRNSKIHRFTIECLMSCANDYKTLENYTKACKYCDKLITMLKTHHPDFETDEEQLEDYLHALYLRIECLSKMKSSKRQAACIEFLKFMNSNPNAQKMMEKDEDYGIMKEKVEYELKCQPDQDLLKETVDQSMAKIHDLLANKKFQESLDALRKFRVKLTDHGTEVSQKVSNNGLSMHEGLSLDIYTSYLLGLCYCELNDHISTVRLFKDHIIDRIEPEFKSRKPDFEFAKVYAALAFCYAQHYNYWDEAYEATKSGIKWCSKKPALADLKAGLTEQYINFLIYQRKFDKALRLWNKNKTKYSKETKALICLMKNNLLQQLQGSDPDLNYEAWWIDLYLDDDDDDVVNSGRTVFTMICCMRKMGQFDKALNMMDQVGIARTHFHINYEVCAYESDVRKSILAVKRMERALENRDELWLLTMNCYLGMTSSDPYKFYNIVKKDLRNTNGSKKLKNSAGKVHHYFNSVGVTLFVRKKLKLHLPPHFIFMQPFKKDKLLF